MTDFSVQQRRALNKLLRRQPAYPSGSLAESFVLKYVFVEALCRLVGRYYRERAKSIKKTTGKTHESIQLDVLGRSFAHFGVQLREERLALLFDSSFDKRGAKSARNLRNGIVHRWDENDVAEASKHSAILAEHFDALIEAIAKRAKVIAR